MKHSIAAILSLSLALLFSSCSKEVPEQAVQLEVNRNNISGLWQLSAWNGQSLVEGSYLYIELVRNDQTFTIWQNLDAFPEIGREITGYYSLRKELALGDIISGKYDYDAGFWKDDYIISKLTATSMTWVSLSDPSFVQEFVRIESLPEL